MSDRTQFSNDCQGSGPLLRKEELIAHSAAHHWEETKSLGLLPVERRIPPISPQVSLFDIPAQLRTLADELDAEPLLGGRPDVLIVVISGPDSQHVDARVFGKRPSAFTLGGMLLQAASKALR